jgi:predicted FMN-binding regulatory protein PaiB
MTDQNTESQNTESKDPEVSPERQNAAMIIANEFLSRATLGEALSQVSLNAIIQLSQNKALEQAKNEVEKLKDEQVSEIIEAANKKAEELAQEAVDQVKPETQSAN